MKATIIHFGYNFVHYRNAASIEPHYYTILL